MVSSCDILIVLRLTEDFCRTFFLCPKSVVQSNILALKRLFYQPKRTRAVFLGLSNQDREDKAGVFTFKSESGRCATTHRFLTKPGSEAPNYGYILFSHKVPFWAKTFCPTIPTQTNNRIRRQHPLDAQRLDGGAMMFRQRTSSLSRVKTIAVAIEVINYLLTGNPPLDTFDREELNRAINALWELPKSYRKQPQEKALVTARVAIGKLTRQMDGFPQWSRAIKPEKLQETAALLPALLAQVQREEDAYWQGFTAGAVAEAERIVEDAQGGLMGIVPE